MSPITETIYTDVEKRNAKTIDLRFKAKDIVTVKCDLEALTISYRVNDGPFVLAYTDVKNISQLHPVVFYLFGAVKFIN
jgi:hypothetical protein